MNAATELRPFKVIGIYANGHGAWIGRTRSYATQEAAEAAARKLAATIHATYPDVTTLTVRTGWYQPTLATFAVGTP